MGFLERLFGGGAEPPPAWKPTDRAQALLAVVTAAATCGDHYLLSVDEQMAIATFLSGVPPFEGRTPVSIAASLSLPYLDLTRNNHPSARAQLVESAAMVLSPEDRRAVLSIIGQLESEDLILSRDRAEGSKRRVAFFDQLPGLLGLSEVR